MFFAKQDNLLTMWLQTSSERWGPGLSRRDDEETFPLSFCCYEETQAAGSWVTQRELVQRQSNENRVGDFVLTARCVFADSSLIEHMSRQRERVWAISDCVDPPTFRKACAAHLLRRLCPGPM